MILADIRTIPEARNIDQIPGGLDIHGNSQERKEVEQRHKRQEVPV